MWSNWQVEPTAQRDAMTEDEAEHEERTGRIHIPVYTCDGWAIQCVETEEAEA